MPRLLSKIKQLKIFSLLGYQVIYFALAFILQKVFDVNFEDGIVGIDGIILN